MKWPIVGEVVVDVTAGKNHTAFLTDKGNVYAIGSNSYGQLGVPNSKLEFSKVPVKIHFPNNEKISNIKTGEHHNLFLSSTGKLYSNGQNGSGQVNGDLDSISTYQCSPKEIVIPSGSKIKEILASNIRSGVILENGEAFYWGGISYHPNYSLRDQPRHEGINKMNTEKGLPEGCKIVGMGLGYFHDLVVTE